MQVSDLFKLPDDRSDYVDDFSDGDLSNGGKYMKVLNDAIANSPAGLSWTDIDAVMVVMAETDSSQFHRGQGNRCTLKMGPGGSNKLVGCAIFSENPSDSDRAIWGRWSHEIGHAFQQGDPAHPSNYSNEFELMDSNYPGQTGVLEKHIPGGFPGWMPAAKYVNISPANGGEQICLLAMEYDPASKPNPQAIKAEITGSLYYMISVRRRVLGDDLNAGFSPNGIPDEGVIIERVSEGADPWVAVKGKGGNRNVLWKAGDLYDGGADGIVIAVDQMVDEDNYCVTVRYNKQANQPDVMVEPWTSPPGNTWETTGIWIDSPVNGYDTFRYGSWNDLSGNSVPRGNGDDPAVGLVNRLYARVYNRGTSPAAFTNDGRVKFEITDPPGLGIAGADGWISLGETGKTQFPGLANIAPGAFVDVYIEWTPSFELTPEQIAEGVFYFHSCVRVKIDPVPGELVLGNQDGDREQENISYFQATTEGSGGAPVYDARIRLRNDDLSNPKYFYLNYENQLPDNWRVDVNGGNLGLELGPGELREIPVFVEPMGSAVVGSIFGVDIFASSQRELVNDMDPKDTHMEFDPLGGVRVEARVLQPTRLSCAAFDNGEILVTGKLEGFEEFFNEKTPLWVQAIGFDEKGTVVTPPDQGVGQVQTDGTFRTFIFARQAIKEVLCLFAGTDKLASATYGRVPVVGPNDPTPVPTDTPPPAVVGCQELFSPSQIPAPTQIDFDDLKDAAIIGTHYEASHGAVFEDTADNRALIYADRPSDPTKALSSPNVAINDAISPNTSEGRPLNIRFVKRQTHVGMYMGNGEQQELTGLLTAYDAGGNIICKVANTPVPESYVEFIGIYDEQGRIASITLDYGKSLLNETIDDLYFAYSPGEPGSETPSPTPTAQPTPTSTPTSLTVAPVQALPYYPLKEFTAILPVIKPDLSIYGIEITQGIQCFDTGKGLAGCADNSLPVATKKDAAARIYLKYSSLFGTSLSNVPVRLHIFANGVEYIANASGRARSTLDEGTTDSADIYFNVNFTNDVAVQFYAEVDPNNTIAESNEGNNRFPASGTTNLTFRRRDTLKIVGQRLRYHPSGYTGTQYAGGWAVNGGAADLFEQLLPVRNNGINYSLKSGYLDWTSTLSTGTGQHALIQQLNTLWVLQNALSWLFGSDFKGAEHVYGWAPDDGYSGGHADMPVYPHAGGLGVVGIGTDRPGTSSNNPGGGALIFIHELVHDYDVKHTNTADSCGSNDGSSAFPYTSSSIQEYGFNTITGKIFAPSNTHDVMSYCPAGASQEGWISPYTWNYMSAKVDALAAANAAATAEGDLAMRTTDASRSLEVNATIFNPAYDPPQPGKLSNLHLVDGGIEYLLPGEGYAIELRDGEGNVLYSEAFGISFESEYDAHAGDVHDDPPFPPEDTPQADVSLIIPWQDGTASVVLVEGSQVLAEQKVSVNSPQVMVTSPATSADWPTGTTQMVTWTGSDADGDALTYSVLYSYTEGDSSGSPGNRSWRDFV